MVKTKLIVILSLFLLSSCKGFEYEWRKVDMDGSRTGCVATRADNVSQAMGYITETGDYLSPCGKIYDSSSITSKVAAIVLDAQPSMARVKKVIATSAEELRLARHETKLSNWFVDLVMNKVEALSGKKIDVGICNFGGIRVNMPKGEVLLDDMLSMFPFKNTVVYLELKGSELRNIFETMAATSFQALGGVNIIAENGKLTKAEIGGKPIEDDRYYSVATISFLLYGGDSLSLAENARNLKVYDEEIIDAVLEHVEGLSSEGKMITAPSDVRVTIVK